MTLNETIISIIKPIAGICVANQYTGDAETYCTFNFSEYPELVGDNTANGCRAMVLLHLFAHRTSNPLALKRRIKRALMAEDAFSLPSVVDASDELSIHFVFEFTAIAGDNDG